ncbi:hypothetical protein IU500_06940 [Nocardia terpenica]|uniref:hypothetical protein n=1 Tax=Nocardia terpenica TaxID=455432 RepID=UPI00189464CB|nr:hypothetical protein [Nocardia terpenica]MBF6060512.1 hypothetical protein [Nocardia terpenica]MBF6103772.1 hypothetical protein [Nocardia terpenica]MBF6111854.1 hypothetical protein [Nocardia terpenica]MBF6117993.1 hypothetical protein [Nocardia terpenica]MBF6155281.1 hypothetical protein [Nocardia terpenica]
MTQTVLGDQTITVLLRTESAAAIDPLGIPETVETPVDQPGCSVQPRYVTEKDLREDFSRSIWIVYAPPTRIMLALTASDAVRYRGDRYEVFGDPMPWPDLDGVIDHIRFELRRARG